MSGLWIGQKTSGALAEFPTDGYFDWQMDSRSSKTRGRQFSIGCCKSVCSRSSSPSTTGTAITSSASFSRRRSEKANCSSALPISKTTSTNASLPASFAHRSSITWQAANSIRRPSFQLIIFANCFSRHGSCVASGLEVIATGDTANASIDLAIRTRFGPQAIKKMQPEKIVKLTISFPNAVQFSGVVIMPRQNHREHEGDVRSGLRYPDQR